MKFKMEDGTEVIVQRKAMTLELPVNIPTVPYFNTMQDVSRMRFDADDDEVGAVYNLVYVIGCGGTGGYVVRDLARYLATLPYANRIIMILMDGDEIEERNLIRQNFISKDVSKNKADVLAARYSAAYGIRILSIPNHLTEENFDSILGHKGLKKMMQLEVGLELSESSQLLELNIAIISCVDNNKTRALISKKLAFHGTHDFKNRFTQSISKENDNLQIGIASMTWIDSGNESNAGQVIVNYDTLFNGWTGDGRRTWIRWNYATRSGETGMRGYSGEPFIPKAAIKTGEETTFTSIGKYMASLDGFAEYKHNIDERYTDKFAMSTKKLIASFDPFAANAANQAKLILGSCNNHFARMFSGFFTPPITWVYPDVLAGAQDKTNLEMSCTERAVADPQNLMVNVQAAAHIVYYASRIFASNPKAAMLNSYGCSWSGTQCVDYKLTSTNIGNVFNHSNLKRVFLWPER